MGRKDDKKVGTKIALLAVASVMSTVFCSSGRGALLRFGLTGEVGNSVPIPNTAGAKRPRTHLSCDHGSHHVRRVLGVIGDGTDRFDQTDQVVDLDRIFHG